MPPISSLADDDAANDEVDEAADTLRFLRADFLLEEETDPDATSIYDIREIAPQRTRPVENVRYVARRRAIRDTRRNLLLLREAAESGWDIGPEISHEERRLAKLEAVSRRATRDS